MSSSGLGWLGIVRLGLVQTALGAIVVLTTSTLNRVMVVELALPAALPGALVGWHYALQVLRPRWGFGADMGGRRTPWIIAGMVVLALGGTGAAFATASLAAYPVLGLVLAFVAFTLVGIGVGAAGTSLLTLLAILVRAERRPAAATIVWLMMICGFIVSTITAGHFLDPFSPTRLVVVTAVISAIAVLTSIVALWRIEPRGGPAQLTEENGSDKTSFREAIAQIWEEPQARRFTIFVFISMLAYSMQDLILEPFAGIVFSMSLGATTKLSGLQHGGVFTGMVLAAVAASPRFGLGSLKGWTIGGCIASALALAGIAAAGLVGAAWPLKTNIFILGLCNGAYAVAAIGSMMMLAGSGRRSREGTRMGLWGASQAIAFAIGGFIGAGSVDILRHVVPATSLAYTIVFACEALLFLFAARLATGAIVRSPARPAAHTLEPEAA